MANKKNDTLSFEKALDELNTLVHSMEEDELKLEDSLKKFERGVFLINECQKALKEAEQKVKILTERNKLVEFQAKEE